VRRIIWERRVRSDHDGTGYYTLLQRNEPGDRERAMSLLDESLAISSELGMRPLMERVLSRREILKAWSLGEGGLNDHLPVPLDN